MSAALGAEVAMRCRPCYVPNLPDNDDMWFHRTRCLKLSECDVTTVSMYTCCTSFFLWHQACAVINLYSHIRTSGAAQVFILLLIKVKIDHKYKSFFHIRQKHHKYRFLPATLFWFIISDFIQIKKVPCRSWSTGCTRGTFNEALCLCHGAGIGLGRVCSGLYTLRIQGTICRDNRLPRMLQTRPVS